MGIFRPTYFGTSKIIKKEALLRFKRKKKKPRPILTKKQIKAIKKKRKKLIGTLKRGINRQPKPFKLRL